MEISTLDLCGSVVKWVLERSGRAVSRPQAKPGAQPGLDTDFGLLDQQIAANLRNSYFKDDSVLLRPSAFPGRAGKPGAAG
jgi:hypothetical protein